MNDAMDTRLRTSPHAAQLGEHVKVLEHRVLLGLPCRARVRSTFAFRRTGHIALCCSAQSPPSRSRPDAIRRNGKRACGSRSVHTWSHLRRKGKEVVNATPIPENFDRTRSFVI
jgi:hypothetical protein